MPLQSFLDLLATAIGSDVNEEFEKLSDHPSRLRFIFPYAKDIIKFPADREKNYALAELLKNTGNKFFQQKQHAEAKDAYNKALFVCPQNTENGKILRDILIANRSAIFFELEMHEKVLKDARILKSFGCHPNPYKFYNRAAKSCEALMKYRSASVWYSESLELLKENSDGDVIKFVKKKLAALKGKTDVGSKMVKTEDDLWTSTNKHYPALSSKVEIRESPEKGRFAVAAEDIKAGEIIGMEKPYIWCLHSKTYLDHCSYCTISTDQFIVCEICCSTCFCSLECKNKAKYHERECRLLHILYTDLIPANYVLGLKWVTMHDLEELKLLEKRKLGNRKRGAYRSNDYFNICNLVSHPADQANVTQYSIVATYFLLLLRSFNYFGNNISTDQLSEDEEFVGNLLIRNFQITQFNCHELGEIGNKRLGTSTESIVTDEVGGGLYATLALFNHSCYSSVIRYTIGNKMVYRAYNSIKAGEEIFENYGPCYLLDSKVDRQKKLHTFYRFQCNCRACEEDWPLYENFVKNVVPVMCACGGTIPVPAHNERVVIRCPKCRKNLKILNAVMSIGFQIEKMKETANLLKEHQFDECIEKISGILEVFRKYLAPTNYDYVLIQNRLRYCILVKGNKTWDFHLDNSAFPLN